MLIIKNGVQWPEHNAVVITVHRNEAYYDASVKYSVFPVVGVGDVPVDIDNIVGIRDDYFTLEENLK